MSRVILSLIVARARNGVIGREGDLPWRLRDDMRFFKQTTLGKPVLMGRKTWDSLPIQPLPQRDNIVLSTRWNFVAPGARVYSSFPTALHAARAIALRKGGDEVVAIGGAGLYAHALPQADRIYLTAVDAAPEGDVTFPDLDPAQWTITELARQEADERNDLPFSVYRYDRLPPTGPGPL